MHSALAMKDDERDIEGDSLGKMVGATAANQDYANQVSGDLRRNNTN
jgi:hypothetical protein